MKTERCNEIEEQLTSYLLGDLEPAATEEVRKHLEECDGCRALVEELKPTLQLLGDALAADTLAPAKLTDERRQRIRAAKPKSTVTLVINWPFMLRAAAVLALCLIGAGLLLPSFMGLRQKASTSVRVAKVEEEVGGELWQSKDNLDITTRGMTGAEVAAPESGEESRLGADLKPEDLGSGLRFYRSGRTKRRPEPPVAQPAPPPVKPAAPKRAPAPTQQDSPDVVAEERHAALMNGMGVVTVEIPAESADFSELEVEEDLKKMPQRQLFAGRSRGQEEAAQSFEWKDIDGDALLEHARHRRDGQESLSRGIGVGGKSVPSDPISYDYADGRRARTSQSGVASGPSPVPESESMPKASAKEARDKQVTSKVKVAKSGEKQGWLNIGKQPVGAALATETYEVDARFALADDDEADMVIAQPGLPASDSTTAAAVGGGTYTIKKGDTLSSIAEREGTTVDELALRNEIADPDRITVGQKLMLEGEWSVESQVSDAVSGVTVAESVPRSEVADPVLGVWKAEMAVADNDMGRANGRQETAEAKKNEVTRTWTATDSSGTQVSGQQEITVAKARAPLMGDIPVTGSLARGEPYARAGERDEELSGKRFSGLDENASLAYRGGRAEEKLEKMVIPSLEFREANINDVVGALVEASREGDPDKVGTSIVLNMPGATGGAPAPDPLAGDTFDATFADADGAGADAGVLWEVPTVTLDLKDVSMEDAVRYVSEVAGLKYRVDENGTIIMTPAGMVSGTVLTRRYPAAPGMIETMIERMPEEKAQPDEGFEFGFEAGRRTELHKADTKQFFEEMGVPFPVGTTVTYDPSDHKLVVSNTRENLEKLERILTQLTEDEPEVDPIFRASGVNPYMETTKNPFSTFAIDVDTASYTLMRNYVAQGFLPPAEAVRTEEFVNFFDYQYRPPQKDTFATYITAAPAPYGSGHLLRVGVKGKRLGREEQRAAVLTLVIDTSGSMNTPDRLGLLRDAVRLLIDNLGSSDQVSIVQYGSQARLVLEQTPVSDKAQILAALDGLQASGSTHLEEGLRLGYQQAARSFQAGAANRVLLLSDGVANLGSDSAEDILASIAGYRKQGIFCSVFGFGLGTYNDAMLETLANKGDGTYQFIDSLDEARRVFVNDLAATLNVIARDVKIQVEFNPARVKRYRQLGYENRQLDKEDFRNDAVDAGEVGSGQSVTALYELDLHGDETVPLGTVRVRYYDMHHHRFEEVEKAIAVADLVSDFEQTDNRFKLGAAVAEFSEILRGSPFAEGSDYEDVAAVLRPVALELNLDQHVQELLRIVQAADGLPRAQP